MPGGTRKVRRAEGVHAVAGKPGEGAAFDQPERAALALDDPRRGARELGAILQRRKRLLALFDVRVGVEYRHAAGFLLPATGFVY